MFVCQSVPNCLSSKQELELSAQLTIILLVLWKSQDTLSSFRNGLGAGGAYSAFVDGVDGNNGFMGWARNTYANTNNKRARKMSAFMPMRGRKDGRDEPSVGSARNDLTVGYNDNPMSDSNRGDSDSVHDWIAASTLSPSLWSSNGDNIQSIEQSHQFVGTPVPLQFANQVAAHRLQQRLMAQPRSAPEMIVADNDGGIVSSSAGDPMTSSGGPLSLAPGAFERTNLAPGSSAGVMQAKLRRAFHPMRGKKWASNDASASIDQVVNEIALARNGGLDM